MARPEPNLTQAMMISGTLRIRQIRQLLPVTNHRALHLKLLGFHDSYEPFLRARIFDDDTQSYFSMAFRYTVLDRSRWRQAHLVMGKVVHQRGV